MDREKAGRAGERGGKKPKREETLMPPGSGVSFVKGRRI
jgi:hypothetical protein